ncbi:hypothetical protein HPB52_010243 [Rhipicephalus sanguineus]|uniref:Endonuclease/exonuclease/phosphatase domain-containing protein n=1 Tax=Rhipicephalus sanguineus TaxID=34632 RepID=A0A9D4PY62_RHISA|nr:hypothetical protein HPB52_010243 [Rhipicephalus sanguineus]
MPRPLPLEEKETLDHGPLPRQCDVHLCSVPTQTGNSCGSGLVSSFASSSRLFCGDMWNKHWLVIFDFREEWALICEATQNSAGNLKGECLWKERDIILNEPYSYKAMDNHLLRLWEARRSLTKRWKKQKLNRKLKARIVELTEQAAGYAAQLTDSNWVEKCKSSACQMSSKGTWRLFRSLVDPTQTRGETQRQLRRAFDVGKSASRQPPRRAGSGLARGWPYHRQHPNPTAMDVQTEGEDSYPATYKPSEWTPIIRAYKGGEPSPETQVVPSQSVPVSAKPTASAVGAPADAAPAVVFRPRGGLALNGAMAQPLMRALQVTAADRDLGELHLRIHPTNNTFTVATAHETTALHLVQLKQLVFQTTTYPVAAYIAPPPSAVRGVISQAYWEETSQQMLQDLQTRNPDAIIAARRMDKHERQDVPSCIPSCILCGGQHLTGTGSCKARNPTAKRHSPPLQKTKFFTKENFPPLDKTYPSTSAWSSGATRPNGATSQDSEVKALREEVKQLRAALSTSSPTLPQISPPPSLPTLSDQPPQKKRRPDESPAQPIDLEAKFQDLAKNLEARFTERITAQSIQLLPPLLKSAVRLAASNPLLIIGDFNCAHVDWGYRRTNLRGTVLYNEALMLQLTIFNDLACLLVLAIVSLPILVQTSLLEEISPTCSGKGRKPHWVVTNT